jgi:hypothetical protein
MTVHLVGVSGPYIVGEVIDPGTDARVLGWSGVLGYFVLDTNSGEKQVGLTLQQARDELQTHSQPMPRLVHPDWY